MYNCYYYVNIVERIKIFYVFILFVFFMLLVFWNLFLILLNGFKEILDFLIFYYLNRCFYIFLNKMLIEYLGLFMILNICN